MSRIDDAAKPFLAPIIMGKPVTLDQAQTTVVARWAALKAIVLEYEGQDSAVTPASDRRALMEHGTVPPYFTISLGNHDLEPQLFLDRAAQLAFPRGQEANAAVESMTKNVQALILVAGCAVFYVFASLIPAFDFRSRFSAPALRERQIWPPLYPEMVWPGERVLDAEDIEMMASRFYAFVAKHAEWLTPKGNA